jgi:hypothetical protein
MNRIPPICAALLSACGPVTFIEESGDRSWVESACLDYVWEEGSEIRVSYPLGDCSEALASGLGVRPGDYPILESGLLYSTRVVGTSFRGSPKGRRHLEDGMLFEVITRRISGVVVCGENYIDLFTGEMCWADDKATVEGAFLLLAHEAAHLETEVHHIDCEGTDHLLYGIRDCDPHVRGAWGYEWSAAFLLRSDFGVTHLGSDDLYQSSINR